MTLRVPLSWGTKTNERDMAPLAEFDDAEILVDSGAFTFYRAGIRRTIDEYADWLATLPFRPWRYFMLDVIGDAAATRANWHDMVARGMDTVPIWTRGAPVEHLDEMLAVAPFVGIGGLANRMPGSRGHVRFCEEYTRQRDQRQRFHWLGWANNDFVRYYQPFSCDTTSWMNGIKYGWTSVYLGAGRWDVTGPNRQTEQKRSNRQIAAAFRRIGCDPARTMAPSWWDTEAATERVEACAGFYIWHSIELWHRFKTRYFVVLSGPQIGAAVAAYRRIREQDWYRDAHAVLSHH